MKKTYYYSLIIVALFAIAPMVTLAEDGDDVVTSKDRLRAAVSNVEQKIEDGVESRLQNVRANQDIRNAVVQKRVNLATTTRKEVRDIRDESRGEMKNASTSLQKREIRNELRKDMFKIELERVIGQISLSLENLKQVRGRIESRIQKATEAGRDMTRAKELLVIANEKIVLAEKSIESLKSLEVDAIMTGTTTASTTTNIKLEKPRKLGEDAIKAVKVARNALNDVVVAIAKNMGLKLGTATTTEDIDKKSSDSAN